ncbi:Signal recognition particle receptor subunit alpha [Smittium culicis]|uniref:Signal recognition particle receptor subunit alpha n=1 Tax=Smittium culicis TaxID=133412 RepID=A0A1R1Y4U0_9FUNG|nr:Signal recognition particle receptor subunit alpha [Smittium culicis]
MLDHFVIATQGGIILWSCSFVALVDEPIKALLKNIVDTTMYEKERFAVGEYLVNWTASNELGLIFIAAYQKILQLSYVEELLQVVKNSFIGEYKDILKSKSYFLRSVSDSPFLYETKFNTIYKAIESKDQYNRRNKATKPKSFESSEKYQNTMQGSKELIEEMSKSNPKQLEEDPGFDTPFLLKSQRKSVKMRTWDSKKSKKDSASASESGSKGKANRVWNDGSLNKEMMKSLDFNPSASEKSSVSESKSLDEKEKDSLIDSKSLGKRASDGTYQVAGMENSNASNLDDDSDTEAQPSWSYGSIGTFFKNLTTGRVLTNKDLNEPIFQMSQHLIKKNVASDIAKKIAESVQQELVGVRAGGMQKISSLIHPAMKNTLSRILTPSTSTDLLRDIQNVNSTKHRPYSIVFVGVNGVGKSTNLSKVCFWLLQNNLRVLIAACDTFRSGAVEQLRVHVKNLAALSPNESKIDLFERGYGKDSATIAKEAVGYAETNGYDVVLIDTAGRMQDNEPLMRALSKLVSVNNPDKIIFVGEALVGNEAIQQLTKFNKALVEYSSSHVKRTIDAIILSKFDTIDDKVGAALTMTYITGKPIIFVGTGQTYTDLRGIRVSSVVDSLLKD